MSQTSLQQLLTISPAKLDPTVAQKSNPFLSPQTSTLWAPMGQEVGVNKPLKNPLFVGYNKKDNTPIYAGSRLFVLC